MAYRVQQVWRHKSDALTRGNWLLFTSATMIKVHILQDDWDDYANESSIVTSHLLRRSSSNDVQTIENNSFETTIIWDHIHLRPVHLRPHSFESIFIWDHIHLRPRSFETTVTWDHIHLRPHSFETTFILDHIHFRSHSICAMSKWSCFDLLWITFL